jgi:hypothetical protein
LKYRSKRITTLVSSCNFLVDKNAIFGLHAEVDPAWRSHKSADNQTMMPANFTIGEITMKLYIRYGPHNANQTLAIKFIFIYLFIYRGTGA